MPTYINNIIATKIANDISSIEEVFGSSCFGFTTNFLTADGKMMTALNSNIRQIKIMSILS
jgi:hypothetical protein